MMRLAFAALRDFLSREDGPTTVEYSIILSLIITVCFGTISVLGLIQAH